MAEKTDGGPAFPALDSLKAYDNSRDGTSGYYAEHVGGMSLRDYFAAHAPKPHFAWISSEMTAKKQTLTEVLSAFAYQHADAMLKARDA